ncbi:MAG: hypothetical protein HY763_15500 [Planctomycetes bacterium]|nr:hypothetical protein [Planctomycetota bacterium]
MVGELVCVRRTATVEEADIVVAWLDGQGIKAQVVDRENIGVRAFGVTDHEGIAVCVADEEAAREARELLEAHDRQRLQGTVVAPTDLVLRCPECGVSNSFPAQAAGTVQECFLCRAFVDVPAR